MRINIFREKTISEKVIDEGKRIEPELRELFIGRRTVFSLLSFVIGSVLIGNSLFLYLSARLEVWMVGVLGMVLFLIGGIISREFIR